MSKIKEEQWDVEEEDEDAFDQVDENDEWRVKKQGNLLHTSPFRSINFF